MTFPTWRHPLPSRVLQAGYDETAADGRELSDPDSGPPIPYLRFTAAVRRVNFQLILDANQKSFLFERFIREDTARGTKAFLMPDQTSHGLVVTGLGSASADTTTSYWWLCQFAKPLPRITGWRGGEYAIVAFAINVLPR